MRQHEPHTQYVIDLLENLHICGERLFDALIENEMDEALVLLSERESMIGRLASVQVESDHAAVRPLAASLRAQNDRIADALDLRRQSIEAALQMVQRMKHGQLAYAGHTEQRSMLRPGLAV